MAFSSFIASPRSFFIKMCIVWPGLTTSAGPSIDARPSPPWLYGAKGDCPSQSIASKVRVPKVTSCSEKDWTGGEAGAPAASGSPGGTATYNLEPGMV